MGKTEKMKKNEGGKREKRSAPERIHVSFYAISVVIRDNAQRLCVIIWDNAQSLMKKADFLCLLEKVQKSLGGWRANLLSLAGRATTIIQSSSQPILTCYNQCMPLPKSICKTIDREYKRFLWGNMRDDGPHGRSSVAFGSAELVLRSKVQMLAAAVWEFQPLQYGGGSLCSPVPGLQSAKPLSHHDLHLPPGRRAVWWGPCGRGISPFGTKGVMK
ncbi:hypothetical protein M9H77_20992 [Catharanthus roseus]|uniref:Uncharacterized protein n=1 Tax=Catharanthus roseus TaxID=4058 RepID=A0ACC0AM69_CATRO|nr:hypothetical protein M9H77_20992 [Catharanthus roseus]